MSALEYLDFEIADDGEGVVSFDALAAVAPQRLEAVRAEVRAVIDWAQAAFGPAAPLDGGGEWDCAVREDNDGDRIVVALTLSGREAFAQALERRFGLQ